MKKNYFHIIEFIHNFHHFFIIPATECNINKKLIQQFYLICKDPEILKILTLEGVSKTFYFKHAEKFLKDSIMDFYKKNLTFYLFEKKIIGVFRVKTLDTIPEIGYFIEKSYRNQGLGKKFIHIMIQNLIGDFDGFIAYVHKENLSSIKILTSENFKLIDKKNDILIFKNIKKPSTFYDVCHFFCNILRGNFITIP